MAAVRAPHPADDTPKARIELDLWRIDGETQATLRQTWPKVDEILDPLLRDFYAFLGNVPGTAPMLAGPGKIDRLMMAQREHWRALFEGRFDDGYADRVTAIGSAHNRAGLSPKYYLSGYSLVLEKLLPELILHNRRNPRRAAQETVAVIRAVMMEIEMALSVYTSANTLDQVRGEMNQLATVFEEELDDAVEFVRQGADAMQSGAVQVLSAAETVSADTAKVAAISLQTSVNSQAIAGGAEELSGSIAEIAQQIERSGVAALDASQRSQEAQDQAEQLLSVSGRIGDIVQLIERISRETRMLALNATIEAARAGAAGRGFSVVAQEVKNLADQTSSATGDIRSEITAMQQAIQATVEVIAEVHHRVEAVTDTFSSIAQAVSEQELVTREIAENAGVTAGSVEDVHGHIASVVEEADVSTREATRMRDHSQSLVHQVLGIKRRVIATLRQTRLANRRREERVPVDMAVALQIGGQTYQGRAENLSTGGMQIREPVVQVASDTPVIIEIPSVGRLEGAVASTERQILHIRFTRLDGDTEQRLFDALEKCKREDAEMVALAKDAARQIGLLFEESLNRRDIGWPDLFDANYEPIPGTDPPKALARFTGLCDRLLPSIQETLLGRSPRIAFCVTVDRNGYLPTHNKKYSAEPRSGDRDWNLAHSRHRRIFDDRTGLAAARNREPVLVQSYHRDMGMGQIMTMKDISAPIMVNGHHWGAFRIGCRM
ncbi:MAG TPA: protoglobin domain-containing protein [Azospirillaceae bacterium]|nr:protoglobin domain-containing protein [Azospirillaceae bacterium]